MQTSKVLVGDLMSGVRRAGTTIGSQADPSRSIQLVPGAFRIHERISRGHTKIFLGHGVPMLKCAVQEWADHWTISDRLR